MTMSTTETGVTDAALHDAAAHLDEYGYCIVEGAISHATAVSLRDRLSAQAEAEAQRDESSIRPDNSARFSSKSWPDKKRLVPFLLNKGDGFRDLLSHPAMRQLVGALLGPHYHLSSFVGHFAQPGGKPVYHTDQWWMPPPITPERRALVRSGCITIEDRGRHRLGAEGMHPVAIQPACVCNIMWTIDNFTADNGATIVVPGSHLSGRQPDPELDEGAGWVPAVAPAGSFIVLDGRVWHSTGVNRTNRARAGITSMFCAWQFRQQENLPLGATPEVLEGASTELLDLIGFLPGSGSGSGYGRIESRDERITRGEYALGELSPT